MQKPNNQISATEINVLGESDGRISELSTNKKVDPIVQAYVKRRGNQSRRSRQSRHSRPGSISLTTNNDQVGSKPDSSQLHHQSLILDTSKVNQMNQQLVLLASSQAYGILETPVEYEETYRDQNTQQLQKELEQYQNAEVDMEVDQVTAKDSARGLRGTELNNLTNYYNLHMADLVTKNPYISDKEVSMFNETRRSRASRSSRLSKQMSASSQKEQYDCEPQDYSQILSDQQPEGYKFYTPGSKLDKSDDRTNTDLPMELSEITPMNDKTIPNDESKKGFDTIDEDNLITQMLDQEATPHQLRKTDCISNDDSDQQLKSKGKSKSSRAKKSNNKSKSTAKSKYISTCKKSQEENKDPLEHTKRQREAPVQKSKLIIKKEGKSDFGQESPLLKTSNIKQKANHVDTESDSQEDCNVDPSQDANKGSGSKKSLRDEKNLLIAKLNTRIQKLHKHREAGDLQLEKQKIQMKDFYKNLRARIDEIENKAQSEIRGHMFTRSQNFSKMLSLVQKQIDTISTENYSKMKNGALDVIAEADSFLSGYQEEEMNKTSTLNGPLESIKEFKNGQKIISFPNYSNEAFLNMIKAEFNLCNLNCEKDNFHHRNESPLYRKNRGFHEKRKNSVTQIGSGLAMFSSRMHDKPQLDLISKSNFGNTINLGNNSTKHIDQNVLSLQQTISKLKAQQQSQTKQDQKAQTLMNEDFKDVLSNYIGLGSNNSPNKYGSQRSGIHQQDALSSNRLHMTAGNISLNHELDVSPRNEGNHTQQRIDKTTSQERDGKFEKKFTNPGLTAKEYQSIQAHISRLQNSGLGSIETQDKSKQNRENSRGDQMREHWLSHLKTHQGHTFGKSDLNHRVQQTENTRNDKNHFEQSKSSIQKSTSVSKLDIGNSTLSNIGGYIAGPHRHQSKIKNALQTIGSQPDLKDLGSTKSPGVPEKKLKSMYYADMIKNSFKQPTDPKQSTSKSLEKSYQTSSGPYKRRTFSMNFNNQPLQNNLNSHRKERGDQQAAQIIKSSAIIRREGSLASHSSQNLTQNYQTVQEPRGHSKNLLKNSKSINVFGQAKRSVGGYESQNSLHDRNRSLPGNQLEAKRIKANVKNDKPKNEDENGKRLSPTRKSKQVILMSSAPQEEQHELNKHDQLYNRKRIFTKIISQPDRIQFQWSHPQLDSKLEDLQYTLEYGCGIKFMGVEQFRKIYQGKAHKCIVADLNATTTYRFRVRPVRVVDDVTVEGYWSEIISVTTLESRN